jgi:hypothetical protein
MKKGYTHLIILIDRSGSMTSIKEDMEGGLVTFLEEQKKLPGKCTLTVAHFDAEYEKVHSMVDINTVESIKINPRATTALLDAMSILIVEAGEELSFLNEEERPEKVLFITITDGEENSSRECTTAKLKNMITEQTEKYNWQFVYLGANQDAIMVASTFGVSSTSTMTYNATSAGSANMFFNLTSATSRYRSTTTMDNLNVFEFTQDEQDQTLNSK